ncbi:heavy metal-binding protein HIP-like isoform X3 [Dreissena polymorpha]|uniref:heavy metal-binding protein HIP-like isoform X3 n=1 Tax=Dreissena polymorpha TaxID=45954 RepID=UPI00226513D8|nr:heavy metal-binding protein HIP-like isoform X3 [Dreissena polymorpha]
MMLMLIAAVFVQVFLTTGHAMSVTGLDDNVSAMEQLLTMVPERTTDNFPLKEMYQQLQKQLKILEVVYQQQQKQLKLLEERIERKEQRNGPSDYATTVNVNTSEVVVGSQAYSKLGSVVFTALKVAGVAHIGENQRITFEKVILNVGNAYSAYSGIFIAPTCGVYMFSVTLAVGTNSFYAALVSTKGAIAWIYTNQAYSTASNTVFVNLAANDHVWVQNMKYNNRVVYGELISSFTGILVA